MRKRVESKDYGAANERVSRGVMFYIYIYICITSTAGTCFHVYTHVRIHTCKHI